MYSLNADPTRYGWSIRLISLSGGSNVSAGIKTPESLVLVVGWDVSATFLRFAGCLPFADTAGTATDADCFVFWCFGMGVAELAFACVGGTITSVAVLFFAGCFSVIISAIDPLSDSAFDSSLSDGWL